MSASPWAGWGTFIGPPETNDKVGCGGRSGLKTHTKSAAQTVASQMRTIVVASLFADLVYWTSPGRRQATEETKSPCP
jgi:hypothetical protein